jgi:hypothetical protein
MARWQLAALCFGAAALAAWLIMTQQYVEHP